MTLKSSAKAGVTITLVGVYLGAHAAHVGKLQFHPPATAGAVVVVSTSVGSSVSWGMFRAQQPMPVEILADTVREYLPAAPVALVMDGDELRRLLAR
jgi:hypothetical protein